MARGVNSIRAAWLDVQEVVVAETRLSDPAPGEKRDGIAAGKWRDDKSLVILPKNCPVTPLGIKGDVCYLVDTLGQIQEVKSSEWKNKLKILFALTPNFLGWAFPRFSEKHVVKIDGETFPAINGVQNDEATQALIQACGMRGLFELQDRVRGRGAWKDKSGGFLWHSGKLIYRLEKGKMQGALPSEYDGIFYQAMPSVIAPYQTDVDYDDSPAKDLLALFKTWNWQKPALDPVLVLGWMVCSLMGASLAWRPHLFITGDKGTGKSTLQDVIKKVLSNTLLRSENTTPAGLYQVIRQDCLGVALDEFEGEVDNRKAQGVINLARVAASGGTMNRGGADHKGTEFTLRSAFIFSAINPPPLAPQDKSRMAILNLGKLGKVKKSTIAINEDTAGRMLIRQIMQHYDDWQRLLDMWKDALRDANMDERGCDTYGTLIAAAHLVLGDEHMANSDVYSGELLHDAQIIAALTAEERAEAGENWRRCINRLLTITIHQFKAGNAPTVGKILEDFKLKDLDLKHARERLNLIGLTIKVDTATRREMLFIPNASPHLDNGFRDTVWNTGGWVNALKQAPSTIIIKDRGNGQNMMVNSNSVRGLFLDLFEFDKLTGEETKEAGDDEL
jgi:hypothetical protein